MKNQDQSKETNLKWNSKEAKDIMQYRVEFSTGISLHLIWNTSKTLKLVASVLPQLSRNFLLLSVQSQMLSSGRMNI